MQCILLPQPTCAAFTTPIGTATVPTAQLSALGCVVPFACMMQNVNNNAQHCGECDNQCPDNEICSGKTCTCAEPFASCPVDEGEDVCAVSAALSAIGSHDEQQAY